MLVKEIRTGMQVQVSQRSGNNSSTYTTRVELVKNDEFVLIQTPTDKGQLVHFVERSKYKLVFLSGSSQYSFESIFLSETQVEGFHMLWFMLTNDGERIQRRDAFRFICDLPATTRIMHENGEQGDPIEGIIRDLSGGGIKYISKENIPEDALLRIDLHLDDSFIMAFGFIKMKKYNPDGVRYPFAYGISFEAMSERDQERIMRFVYNEQSKMLRKTQRSLMGK